MKRNEIIGYVADIYEEVGINEFGFDYNIICDKYDIKVIPYLDFQNMYGKFKKCDEDGFTYVDLEKNHMYIVYDDFILPKNRVKFTIGHELGHIFLGHHLMSFCEKEEEWMKKEADTFANELYCPQAFMIHYNIKDKDRLVKLFNITDKYAEVLLSKLEQRENKELSFSELRLICVFENNKK